MRPRNLQRRNVLRALMWAKRPGAKRQRVGGTAKRPVPSRLEATSVGIRPTNPTCYISKCIYSANDIDARPAEVKWPKQLLTYSTAKL